MAFSNTIAGLLSDAARREGGKPFLHFSNDGTTLSFEGFAAEAASLARTLADFGAGHGTRISSLLLNGPNAAVGMLGALSLGSLVAPLNPNLTEEELRSLLSDAKASLLIADEESLSNPNAAWLSGHTVAKLAELEKENPLYLLHLDSASGGRRPVDEDDLALLVFTSGTTSRPKGALLTHGNLLANARFVVKAHGLSTSDLALCILPLYHINGFVTTLLSPLTAGHGVVMPRKFSAQHFWEWAKDYDVSWFSAVPTIYSILLSHEQEAPSPNRIRFARSASAPLPVAVKKSFEDRFEIPIVETYGLTETAGQIASNPMPPLKGKPGSVGLAVGNEIRVADEKGENLPAGAIGEVLVSGPNIGPGYLDNPAATSTLLRDGWLHTGDLGHLDGEGFLFLTGRSKEIINRGGEKIAPREIEELIYQLPEVQHVGVTGIPDPVYGEAVAALVVLKDGRKLRPEDLLGHCERHLAKFKLPSKVKFVDYLPTGPNGKIQRRKLAELLQPAGGAS